MFKDLASQVISLHKQKAFSWNNDYLMVLMVPCWKAYLRRGVKKSARRKQRRGHQGLVLMKHEQHAYIQVYIIYIYTIIYKLYIYTGQIIIVETNEIERLQAAKSSWSHPLSKSCPKKNWRNMGTIHTEELVPWYCHVHWCHHLWTRKQNPLIESYAKQNHGWYWSDKPNFQQTTSTLW